MTNKDKTIHIRLSFDEYIDVVRRAKHIEGMTVSQYVRNLLFPPHLEHMKEPIEDTTKRTIVNW